MAAIEALGDAHEGRQQADDAPLRPLQVGVAFVRLLRRRLAVVARDEGDDLDLLRVEAAQVAVPDQVVRVLVMAAVADVDADVVQQRPELQPLALARPEAVPPGRLIEQLRGHPRHLTRMLGPVVAALAELLDAAAADVGIALDGGDVALVAPDVVEDQPFAQRHLAERDLVGAEAAEDGVEQHGAGDRQVGAPRIEPGHLQARGLIGGDERLADLVDGLGRHAAGGAGRRRRGRSRRRARRSRG